MKLPSLDWLVWGLLLYAVATALKPEPAPDAVRATATPLDMGLPAKQATTIADVLGFRGGWR